MQKTHFALLGLVFGLLSPAWATAGKVPAAPRCVSAYQPRPAAAPAAPVTVYRISPECAKTMGISLKPTGRVMPIPKNAKIETLSCCPAPAMAQAPAPALPATATAPALPSPLPAVLPNEGGHPASLPGKAGPTQAQLEASRAASAAQAPDGNPSFSQNRTALAVGAVALFAGAAVLLSMHEEAQAKEAAKAQALERGDPAPADVAGWDGPADPETAHQRAVQAAIDKAVMQKMVAAR